MAPKPKTYEWGGELLTVKQLAKIRSITKEHMANLIKRHGLSEAMTMELSRMAGVPKGHNHVPPDKREAPSEYREDLQLERTIQARLDQGWDVDKIASVYGTRS
ncbi:MAG: hypothetical protein GQ570_03695 [Helicobacteraceae bacterium]|nr:hypothetical protein [Helicobacteraceae bacterium]